MSTTCILLLLFPLISAQSFNWGPCPNPKVQPDFDLNQYLGKWYEIEKIPAAFSTGTCIQANYSLRKDGSIRVYNTQVLNGVRKGAEGTAVIQDQRAPAKLGVSFSRFSPYGPYWVLNTDYNNTSVVYSCTDVLRVLHFEYAWILARTPFLEPQEISQAKALLTSEGVDVSEMTPTDQSCK